MSTATLMTERTTEIHVLRSKAADLRSAATDLDAVLAPAYRRRAAELELTATALAARLGYDEPVLAAA